jgi:hypothetical protein
MLLLWWIDFGDAILLLAGNIVPRCEDDKETTVENYGRIAAHIAVCEHAANMLKSMSALMRRCRARVCLATCG